MFVYSVCAHILKFAVHRFYARITIEGTPKRSGPVIFAGNHPNQALDPLLIGAHAGRDLWFLAKSTLFRNPFLAFFFRTLHMIPVYRKEDGGGTSKNDSTFREAESVLRRGGAFVIFPEGTSTERRLLLPLKTGAARIALQTEAQEGFALRVCIQPFRITYAMPRLFKSSVTISFAEPIPVAPFGAGYQEDPVQCARLLTDALDRSLRAIEVDIEEERYQEVCEAVVGLFDDDRQESEVSVFSRMVKRLKILREDEEPTVMDLGRRISLFLAHPEARNLPLWLFDDPARSKSTLWVMLLPRILGAAVNFPPYEATDFIVRHSVQEPYNLASAKLGFGILCYALWYLFLLLLAVPFPPCWVAILFVIGVGIVCGRYTRYPLWGYLTVAASLVSPRVQRRIDPFVQERRALQAEVLQFEVQGSAS